MTKTRVSDKYQVVIPKVVRQQVGIKEGQELYAYSVGRLVILTPDKKESGRQWPDDYIALLKDSWQNVDVQKYLDGERMVWD